MNIAIDVDEVIRNLVQESIDVYREVYNPTSTLQKSEILTWDYTEYMPEVGSVEEFLDAHKARIFGGAPIIEGAKEGIDALHDAGHFIGIATASFPETEIITLNWLKYNKIKFDAIHFTEKKGLLDYDILFDDAIHNLKSVSIKNTPICFDRPWNRSWPRIRVSGWKEFVAEVDQLSGGVL